jgi:hypothetical protein
VTSHDRFSLIAESRHISTNADGAPWRRLASIDEKFCSTQGLRLPAGSAQKTDEGIEQALDDFYFLSPPPLGNDLVFLLLSLESYTGLLHWEDLAPEVCE